MKCLLLLLLAVLLCGWLTGLAKSTHVSPAPVQSLSESFSFESDMQGWMPRGTDLEYGIGDTLPWHIIRSQEMATDGSFSLNLYLNNANDRGKIWVERPFAVEPNQLYEASIHYDLASMETVTDNTFSIITGALNKSPQTARDLMPAYQDYAINGSKPNPPFKWKTRTYHSLVRSDEQGILYIVIGIAGNFEMARTYYMDNVGITITKKPVESQFFSFEDDLQGWTPRATDLAPNSGAEDASVTRTQYVWEEGLTALSLNLNSSNSNSKLWMERAFAVEPRQVYTVEVEYSFAIQFPAPPFFSILTGVSRVSPESGDDLIPLKQEIANNERGYGLWLRKSYAFKVKTNKSDTLYVVIGIWGQELAHRLYWLDSVCVTITKRQ